MLLQSIEHQQNELRQQLKLAIEDLKNAYQSGNYDFIVSHSEVNDRHGVGVLLKRIFRNNQNIVSIRSRNLYDGKDDFGNFNFLIHHDNYDINAVYEQVRSTLGNLKPKRILCIPYFLDDILTAIAIKDIFEAGSVNVTSSNHTGNNLEALIIPIIKNVVSKIIKIEISIMTYLLIFFLENSYI